jgi:hypothetical protein
MSFFGFLNILGYKPELFTKTRDRVQSNLGWIMSIISILTCLAFTIYFFIEFFSRTNLSVLKRENSEFEKYLSTKDFPIMMKIGLANGSPIGANITYPVVTFWQFYPQNDGHPNITFLKLEQCQEKHFGSYGYLFMSSEFKDYLCLSQDNNTESSLYGVQGDVKNGYSNILIYMTRCVNESVNNPGVICEANNKIDELFSAQSPNLLLTYPDYSLEHNNLTNPLKINLKLERLGFPPKVKYRHDLNFQKVNYNSDDGYIFRNSKSFFSTGYESLTSKIFMGSKFFIEESYGLTLLSLYEKEQVYDRSYLKLQIVIANVGGFVKSIIIFSNLIINYLTYQYHLFNLFYLFLYDECESDHIESKMNFMELSNKHIKNDTQLRKIEINKNIKELNIDKEKKIYLPNQISRPNVVQLEQNNKLMIKPLDFKIEKSKSNYKNLSFFEALRCNCCVKANSNKFFLLKYENYFRSHLSVENLIRCSIYINKIIPFKSDIPLNLDQNEFVNNLDRLKPKPNKIDKNFKF